MKKSSYEWARLMGSLGILEIKEWLAWKRKSRNEAITLEKFKYRCLHSNCIYPNGTKAFYDFDDKPWKNEELEKPWKIVDDRQRLVRGFDTQFERECYFHHLEMLLPMFTYTRVNPEEKPATCGET